jgi:hypothetical protein
MTIETFRPWWYNPKAAGQPLEGACQIEIENDTPESLEDEIWEKYEGMYNPRCNCKRCSDRKQVHRQETAAAMREQTSTSRSAAKEKLPDADVGDLLLNRGVSVAQAASSRVAEEPGSKWHSQRYAVRQEMVDVVIKMLKCPKPTIDIFADAGNARCSRFWGKGGEKTDAWAQDWGAEEGPLWCNPPFTLLNNVVTKASTEGANIILIAPDWKDHQYYKDMWSNSRSHWYFPVGTHLFELDGTAVPGIRWPCWAVWLDGRLQEKDRVRRKIFWGEAVQRTGSAKRRFRQQQQNLLTAIGPQGRDVSESASVPPQCSKPVGKMCPNFDSV